MKVLLRANRNSSCEMVSKLIDMPDIRPEIRVAFFKPFDFGFFNEGKDYDLPVSHCELIFEWRGEKKGDIHIYDLADIRGYNES